MRVNKVVRRVSHDRLTDAVDITVTPLRLAVYRTGPTSHHPTTFLDQLASISIGSWF